MLPLFGTPVLHNIELCPNFSNKNPAYWADFLLLQSACRLGSENYVRYSDKKYLNVMEKTNKLDFLYKNTCKYENSSSLNNICVYRKIDWNRRS